MADQTWRSRDKRWRLVLLATVAVGLAAFVVVGLAWSPRPVGTPGPSTAVGPSLSAAPSASPGPTNTPRPTGTARPSPSPSPSRPAPSDSPEPSPSAEPVDGIPGTWLGAVVLRGQELRDAMGAATDDTPGFAGGYLRYLTRDCVISPTPFPATHLVQPCDDGWTLVDSPGDESGIPVAILRPGSGSWALGVAMIVSVHSHDASAATCPASIATRCDQAFVLDRVVWSADSSDPTGSPPPSPTIPPADPPRHEGRWTRVGGNAIDRFGGSFQLWPTDGALFATSVKGESDDGSAVMTILSSKDGVRWHVMGRIQQSPDYLTSFVRFHGHFVAVSESESIAPVWYSEDGSDWTWIGDQGVFLFGGGDMQIGSVLPVGDHLEMMADHRSPSGDITVIWLSSDGLNWTLAPQQDANGPSFGSFQLGHGLLLAADQHEWTSIDGLSWTRLRGVPRGAYIHVTSWGYFAVQGYRGEESKQWVSTDLRHWQRVGPIETGESDEGGGYYVGPRIFTGDVIVAITGEDPETPIVSWSADGKTWRFESLPEHVGAYVEDVAIFGHHVILSGEVDPDADHSRQVVWVADLPTR